MRPIGIPGRAKLPRREAVGSYETEARGLAVLNSPQLNKGTAFTAEESGKKPLSN
jgi:hypothetical protein